MNPINSTFEDYEAQYETFLPIKVREGLTYVQVSVHHAVTVIDDIIPITQFVLLTLQGVVTGLSFIPSVEPYLAEVKQFCRDSRNLTYFVKGLKSIDGFLNFKYSWKPIILNVSGMTLFIVSSLTLIDRFQLFDVTVIKVYLTTIPVFGILPYGGFLSFSLIGLAGMVTLLAFDKKSQLEKDEARIKNEKLVLWSQPLNALSVKQKRTGCEDKVLKLKEDILAYEALIAEGKERENDYKPHQVHPIFACRKALDELIKTLAKQEKELLRCEKIFSQWKLLEENWIGIDSQDLEYFRQAKEKKWKAKLNKIVFEKSMILFSIISHLVTISRHLFVIISAASGYGRVSLPLSANIGFDTIASACFIKKFLIKKSIKKIKVSSVKLSHYVN